MAEGRSEADRDPGRERQQLYDVSIKIIGALAPRRDHGQGVKGLLDEIEEAWGFYPWSIAAGSAMTLAVHAGTPRKEDRERVAAMMRRRRTMLRAVARLRKEYTASGDPLSVIVIDGPRPEWEGLMTGGKPGAFYLERYVDLLVTVLAEERWPDPPPEEGADPYRQAITMAAELLGKMGILPRAGGRQAEKQRDLLRLRWRRFRKRGEPPPPRPDDADPLGWASDVWWWLREGAAARDRRRPLGPPFSAVVDVLVAAGGKLQFARHRVDPSYLEHLRRVLSPTDLAIFFALQGLTLIIEERGTPERLRRAALGESPAGPPSDPGPPAGPRK